MWVLSNGSGHIAIDFKLSNILQLNRFQSIVAVLTVLWVLFFAIFISIGVGWRNVFGLLPHEIGAVILAVIVPILIAIVVIVVVGMSAEISQVTHDSRQHGEMFRTLLDNANSAGGSSEMDGQWLVEAFQMQKLATDDMADVLNAHRALSENINEKLTAYIQSEQDDAGKFGSLDSGEISQKTALMGLVNIVLNDLSVSSTRILVRLLELENLTKDEIKDLMQGLIGAYSAGDKDVFFRILHQRLAVKPEWVQALHSLASESSMVSGDLSKILRGSNEVLSLVEQCDKGDIIGIIFDANDIKTLRNILETYFDESGTPKVLPATQTQA